MNSRLPKGGTNLFQGIKKACLEAEKNGKAIYRLSIGQPSGPAFLSARKVAAETVMSSEESVHEYQDNGSPGVPGFAPRFVQAHVPQICLKEDENIDYLPTPGNKPMLGMVILSCNLRANEMLATTTDPGYPTPADQAKYLKVQQYSLPTNPGNFFQFDTRDIKPGTKLIMVNYPHNPSGQIASFEWWESLCDFCEKKGIRLFNDNPYQLLSHSAESTTLTRVAIYFPGLSWAEAFSGSKVIGNGTGWRVGAIAGSKDFVGDIATIKSNSDSGFAAPMAAGVLHAIENDQKSIASSRRTYARRIKILTEILPRNGMLLAVEPKAGFFTLWRVPKKAFGQDIKDAEEFNFLMIEKTGIAGVHFHPYIRYSVTGDIEKMQNVIEEAFAKANVSY
jgi:LL-diaminopimelate aminotransferase